MQHGTLILSRQHLRSANPIASPACIELGLFRSPALPLAVSSPSTNAKAESYFSQDEKSSLRKHFNGDCMQLIIVSFNGDCMQLIIVSFNGDCMQLIIVSNIFQW